MLASVIFALGSIVGLSLIGFFVAWVALDVARAQRPRRPEPVQLEMELPHRVIVHEGRPAGVT